MQAPLQNHHFSMRRVPICFSCRPFLSSPLPCCPSTPSMLLPCHIPCSVRRSILLGASPLHGIDCSVDQGLYISIQYITTLMFLPRISLMVSAFTCLSVENAYKFLHDRVELSHMLNTCLLLYILSTCNGKETYNSKHLEYKIYTASLITSHHLIDNERLNTKTRRHR